MYDYFLGGSHNFEADRATAKAVEQIFPGIATTAQANRSFLRRAVRHLASAGIDQFLDLGSGIPTVGNVHEIAQQSDPTARVVYVDVEPVAVSHSNALLANNPYAVAVRADLRLPSKVLRPAAELLDFSRPVALLLIAALHFVPDSDNPHGFVAQYLAGLVPGSFLVLSHGSLDGLTAEEDAEASEVRSIYQRTDNPLTLRSHAEVTRFFDGLDLLAPGVVPVNDWRPDTYGDYMSIYAGVARRAS